MSREKQIKETRNLREIGCDNVPFEFCNKYDRCEDCPIDRMATALYNAGYRKQSEGEWIPTYTYTAEGTGIYKCSLCGRKSANPKADNFCPNCGAEMKGGAE